MSSELAPGGGPLARVAGWLGLADLVPYGPVVTPASMAALASAPRRSGVLYTGRRRCTMPVLPLQVFGVAYDVDLVLVTTHPTWHMHEYARLSTPDGPVWLCKDARRGSLEQTIVADLPDLQRWLPEVSVPRKASKVTVRDLSTRSRLHVELAYDNPDGEPVEVRYEGPMPTRLEARRNTSTMGHSRAAVMAVLDLSHKAFGVRASVRIGGRPQPLARILGVAPFRLALVQTQAGFSIGSWSQRARGADGFETVHASGARQPWDVRRHDDVVEVVQEGVLRTLRYRFRVVGEALELERATVEPWDRATPACAVAFWPPLPDPALRFQGSYEGTWVVDVNGQAGHAIGRLRMEPTADGADLELEPTAPAWVTDRPMRGSISCQANEVDVGVVMAAP